jgi:molybdenum cofactor cytidylyltransferase
MGRTNKLLAPVGGRPMVRRVVDALVPAPLSPVLVLTGHEADAVRRACAGASVTFVHNPAFGLGMSTSLRLGVERARAHPEVDGLLVALGDMPWVEARHILSLVAAFRDRGDLVAPRFDGHRGHPVVFGRDFFPELATVEGDAGARAIIQRRASDLTWVDMVDDAILRDVDTPDDLENASRTDRR